MSSVEPLLDDLEGVELDLDSEYFEDFVRILNGKVSALERALSALGHEDLAADLRGLLLNDDIYRTLEVARGYVIPAARERLADNDSHATAPLFGRNRSPAPLLYAAIFHS